MKIFCTSLGGDGDRKKGKQTFVLKFIPREATIARWRRDCPRGMCTSYGSREVTVRLEKYLG